MTQIEHSVSVRDAHAMAANCRSMDRLEWETALGVGSLLAQLKTAVATAPYLRCLRKGDEVLAVWGAHTVAPGVGQVWFLATPETTRYVHRLHRAWATELAHMHWRWATLVAYTHADNDVHHEWLIRRGFRLKGSMKVGFREQLYFEFRHERSH